MHAYIIAFFDMLADFPIKWYLLVAIVSAFITICTIERLDHGHIPFEEDDCKW
ncbi:hypothetical protein D3C84_556370 [compost metagenome]